MDRRITTYNRFHEGYGEILVQMNVEDTRLGVAEYVLEKHGLKTIELKWGQGAKCIGGEIKVKEIERARELQRRGYVVTPDPSVREVEMGYDDGAITEFERHSRLGFVTRDAFMAEVERLRKVGFERVTLKTGAYSMVELAMAMRFCAEAEIDLLTIDGAPGGTGMSPWPMMNEWGVPTLYLQSLAYEFAEKLTAKGLRVPDLAMAGGFAHEPDIYKVLALGAPYFKAVCMGRALMIPGMLGKNMETWLKDGDLPKTVAKYGTTVEEIFLNYEEIKEKYGSDFKDIPLGAIALFTFARKTRVGLQQLMAGSRRFSLPAISRKDIMSLTEECAKVTGIPYVMDNYREEAEKILEG
jgi:glutamate synthase domain-containing protein 2